jgi:hypothetical protein
LIPSCEVGPCVGDELTQRGEKCLPLHSSKQYIPRVCSPLGWMKGWTFYLGAKALEIINRGSDSYSS